jgi:hypothetical protein
LQALPSSRHALDLVTARGFAIERIPRAAFDDGVLAPLHAFAARLMAESYEHFAVHARTNDELHVYRRASGELVGFQLWRCFGDPQTGARYVLGGKLRVDPAARRNGLHHASNLAILLAEREAHPGVTITRLSIASLFGFVSLVRAMPRYRFVDATSAPDLATVFARVARENGYTFDPETGLVDVGIVIPSDQLARYGADYFARTDVRTYVARNADFARNRRFVAVAFDVDEDNLSTLARSSGQQSPP